jgi:hypothetical protein
MYRQRKALRMVAPSGSLASRALMNRDGAIAIPVAQSLCDCNRLSARQLPRQP